jgi:hypothetical protein
MTGFDENGRKSNKSGQGSSRDARLAAALRENLRRRKAQERARGADEPGRDGLAGDGDGRPVGKPGRGDGNP